MTNVTQTLDFLIKRVTTIINGCKDSEDLLLATKASSTLLQINPIADQWETLQETIFDFTKVDTLNENFFNVLYEIFDLFKAIINESDALIDLMLIAKSFKKLMEKIYDTVILNNLDMEHDHFVKIEKIASEITDSIVNRVKMISDTIDDAETAFFAANVLSNLNKTKQASANVNDRLSSIEELNTKIDSVVNEHKGDMSIVNNKIDNLNNQLSETIRNFNNLANDKNNPHEVTKEQLGLTNALIGYKTEDINNSDTDKFHPAKITNQIYILAKEKVDDAPSDNNFYVRKNSKWVEGMGEFIPIGAIMPYSSKTPPNGWLMIEGDMVYDKIMYPKLYDHLLNNYPHLIIDEDTFKLTDSIGFDAFDITPNSTEKKLENFNCIWIIKAYDSISDPTLIESQAIIDQVRKNTTEIETIKKDITTDDTETDDTDLDHDDIELDRPADKRYLYYARQKCWTGSEAGDYISFSYPLINTDDIIRTDGSGKYYVNKAGIYKIVFSGVGEDSTNIVLLGHNGKPDLTNHNGSYCNRDKNALYINALLKCEKRDWFGIYCYRGEVYDTQTEKYGIYGYLTITLEDSSDFVDKRYLYFAHQLPKSYKTNQYVSFDDPLINTSNIIISEGADGEHKFRVNKAGIYKIVYVGKGSNSGQRNAVLVGHNKTPTLDEFNLSQVSFEQPLVVDALLKCEEGDWFGIYCYQGEVYSNPSLYYGYLTITLESSSDFVDKRYHYYACQLPKKFNEGQYVSFDVPIIDNTNNIISRKGDDGGHIFRVNKAGIYRIVFNGLSNPDYSRSQIALGHNETPTLGNNNGLNYATANKPVLIDVLLECKKDDWFGIYCMEGGIAYENDGYCGRLVISLEDSLYDDTETDDTDLDHFVDKRYLYYAHQLPETYHEGQYVSFDDPIINTENFINKEGVNGVQIFRVNTAGIYRIVYSGKTGTDALRCIILLGHNETPTVKNNYGCSNAQYYRVILIDALLECKKGDWFGIYCMEGEVVSSLNYHYGHLTVTLESHVNFFDKRYLYYARQRPNYNEDEQYVPFDDPIINTNRFISKEEEGKKRIFRVNKAGTYRIIFNGVGINAMSSRVGLITDDLSEFDFHYVKSKSKNENPIYINVLLECEKGDWFSIYCYSGGLFSEQNDRRGTLTVILEDSSDFIDRRYHYFARQMPRSFYENQCVTFDHSLINTNRFISREEEDGKQIFRVNKAGIYRITYSGVADTYDDEEFTVILMGHNKIPSTEFFNAKSYTDSDCILHIDVSLKCKIGDWFTFLRGNGEGNIISANKFRYGHLTVTLEDFLYDDTDLDRPVDKRYHYYARQLPKTYHKDQYVSFDDPIINTSDIISKEGDNEKHIFRVNKTGIYRVIFSGECDGTGNNIVLLGHNGNPRVTTNKGSYCNRDKNTAYINVLLKCKKGDWFGIYCQEGNIYSASNERYGHLMITLEDSSDFIDKRYLYFARQLNKIYEAKDFISFDDPIIDTNIISKEGEGGKQIFRVNKAGIYRVAFAGISVEKPYFLQHIILIGHNKTPTLDLDKSEFAQASFEQPLVVDALLKCEEGDWFGIYCLKGEIYSSYKQYGQLTITLVDSPDFIDKSHLYYARQLPETYHEDQYVSFDDPIIDTNNIFSKEGNDGEHIFRVNKAGIYRIFFNGISNPEFSYSQIALGHNEIPTLKNNNGLSYAGPGYPLVIDVLLECKKGDWIGIRCLHGEIAYVGDGYCSHLVISLEDSAYDS